MHRARISFIAASNDEDVLRKNLLASPDLGPDSPHELIVVRDAKRIGEAYNRGADQASNDVLVFLHQDIYLPEGWAEKFLETWEELRRKESSVGVLGCFGVTRSGGKAGYVYSNGLGRVLGTSGPPIEVRTLDEIVLSFRRSSGLRFDPELPGFHLYGTDICLEAERRGLRCYAIADFCIHNSLPIKYLDKRFWACVEYEHEKWRDRLPIDTSCVTIHRNHLSMLFHRIRQSVHYLRRARRIRMIRRRENFTVGTHHERI